MKTLKIIKDTDVGSDTPDLGQYTERRAARAIVFDADKKVALLHATVKDYHKLPGGGIEGSEDPVAALKRECQEEIGCDVTNIKELGVIEEYRNQFGVHQTSYCFVADVAGAKGTPHLEEDEIAEGFETVWMSLDEAVQTLEREKSHKHYEGNFMTLRDYTFLAEVKSIQ
jgi:8-oxo-dGTP diphosphatase